MPKVQSRRSRPSKAQPFETMMVDEVKPNIVSDASDEGQESNHSVHKRQAGEWKKMKAQVSQLKSQRKALGKKQRETKKELSKQIKLLIVSTEAKHLAELRALGIVPPKATDRMVDDEDMDD